MTEPTTYNVDIRAEYYYRDLTLPKTVAWTERVVREKIDEWSYATDPHGYCHERPLWISLLQEIARLRAAVATTPELVAEIEKLRRDKAWELRRANEAARQSADARDRTDDLLRQMEQLRDETRELHGALHARDRWAFDVIAEHAIPHGGDDEHAVVARWLKSLVTERDQLTTSLRESRGQVDLSSQTMATQEAEIARLTEELTQARRPAVPDWAEAITFLREKADAHQEQLTLWAAFLVAAGALEKLNDGDK